MQYTTLWHTKHQTWHTSMIWFQTWGYSGRVARGRVSGRYGHTMKETSHPVSSGKLSFIGPSQYWPARAVGNGWCCTFCHFIFILCFLSSISLSNHLPTLYSFHPHPHIHTSEPIHLLPFGVSVGNLSFDPHYFSPTFATYPISCQTETTSWWWCVSVLEQSVSIQWWGKAYRYNDEVWVVNPQIVMHVVFMLWVVLIPRVSLLHTHCCWYWTQVINLNGITDWHLSLEIL